MLLAGIPEVQRYDGTAIANSLDGGVHLENGAGGGQGGIGAGVSQEGGGSGGGGEETGWGSSSFVIRLQEGADG